MERLLPLAEQLDRAAVELRLDHPIHNRLALILIDNAIEIMVRTSLWVHVGLGGDIQGLTPKQRTLARSQRFDDRLNVLAFVNEISHDEAAFIIAAHRHRNAAYHEGFVYEDYLRQLAFEYFRFACSYLVRFEMGFYSWSSAFQFTEIGRRYYDATRDSERLGQISRPKLARMLLDQLPAAPEMSLQQALANELEEAREGIVSGFRFLIENTYPKQSWRYLLGKAQFDYARDEALEKKGLEQTLYDTDRRREAVKYVKANLEKFRPRYRALPHGSWSQGIARLKSNPDPRLALIQFNRLRLNMQFLREAIGYAVMKLEGELERD